MVQWNMGKGAAAALAASMLGIVVTATSVESQVLGPAPAPSGPVARDDAAPPLPAEDIPAVLNRLELTAVGQAMPRKKGTEIAARTKDGRPVVVKFDRFGRLREVEAGRAGPAAAAFATSGEIEAAVRRAGFEPRGIVDVKKDHVTVLAATRDQQPVELHVDRSGTVYKQKWLR